MQHPYLNFFASSEAEAKLTYNIMVNLLPAFTFSLFHYIIS